MSYVARFVPRLLVVSAATVVSLVSMVLGWPGAAHLDAQVSYDRIRKAAEEPHNWLTYNGTYSSQRHSLLDQITPANVSDLELQWILQNEVVGAWQ